HSDLVRTDGRLAEVGQSFGRVVPLEEIAEKRSRILRTMVPFHAWAALVSAQSVPCKHVDRDASHKSVIDHHRGVLQSYRPMRCEGHGFAFDSVIAMSDTDGRFFVTARQPFGTLIATIIDEGFLQRPETRPGVCRNVLQVQ